MLMGRREPALGGDGSCVDVVGLNFYHDNQWEYPSGRKLAWHVAPRDARWRPLHGLLQEVFERYRRPLYLTETSHVGDGRAAWLRELSDEVHVAIEGGVPILGVCLYPIVDRCGWDDATPLAQQRPVGPVVRRRREAAPGPESRVRRGTRRVCSTAVRWRR